MKLLTSFTLIATLATTAAAEAPPAPAPAPPAKRVEVSKADGEKFMAFFNKLVGAIVQNKEDCPKMASAVTVVIDANVAMLKKTNEQKAAGKRLPKALEDKMMARVKDEMLPAMQKCGGDKDVQAALARMENPGAPAPKPAK